MPASRAHVAFAVPSVAAALVLATVALAGPSGAAQGAVGLGTVKSFAVLAGTTVTNTGPSHIAGSVGLSPGTAITGFPPAIITHGTSHAADAVALQAQADVTTAYNDAAGRTPVVDKTSQDLGGQTLVGGVYQAASAMALTGTVTLDAQGDPDTVFIFQAGSTLITASNAKVALIGGAVACNVYWQVGSSATLGTATSFVGTIMALTSATLQTGATLQGRVLARNGQVSLDTNTITRPGCATTPTPTPTPTTSPSPSTSPSASPTSGATSPGSTTGPRSTSTGGAGGGGNGAGTGSGTGSGTSAGGGVVPSGHPDTGAPVVKNTSTSMPLLAAILLFVAAAVAAASALRQTRRRRLRPRHL